jgi:hypothetical protein
MKILADLLLIFGMASVAWGIRLIWLPAGYVAFGIGLLVLALAGAGSKENGTLQ